MTDLIENKIRLVVEKSIAREQLGLDRHELIVKHLKPFEGKLITKRIETALNKVFVNHEVHIDRRASLINLEIWKKHYKDGDHTSHLLGYSDSFTRSETSNIYREGVYDKEYSGFEYYDNCHGNAAKQRVKRDKTFLKNGSVQKLAASVKTFLEAKAKVKKFENCESWFALIKALDLGETKNWY